MDASQQVAARFYRRGWYVRRVDISLDCHFFVVVQRRWLLQLPVS